MTETDTIRILDRLDIMSSDITALQVAVERIETRISGYPIADHENRIRHLEAWQWRAIGIATAIGLLPGIGSLILVALKLHGA